VPSSGTTDIAVLLAGADTARLQGDWEAALKHYARAVQISPSNTYAHYWLATIYEQEGQLQKAREHCELALRVEPEQIGVLLRLGSIATAARDHKLALDSYLRAAVLDPEIPDIDSMLADQYCFLGQIEKGVERFNAALRKDPTSKRLQSNRLFVLNYADRLSDVELFEEHRRWGQMHETSLRELWRPHDNPRNPERPLRIGYVSGDLRNHAVSYFVEPLLAHHDVREFQVVCFDVSRNAEDAITARLKSFGHCWRRVGELDDDALAQAIRDERIDILVDLSGHTHMNRLLAFARKPAPIQATWLGYLGTTGLTSMDYRITDAYLDPPGETESYHTERLHRLPNAACFSDRGAVAQVGELPADKNRYITFGSVNQWSKVTPSTIETWCEILRKVADARLLVIASGASNPARARDVVAEFASRGVDERRVLVHPMTDLEGFLSLLGKIDIALDPFPYGGGTTTMHSLWMGVPVITLAGQRAFSRNAVGPLTEVGFRDLVARTPTEYLQIAERLARDLDRLRAGRNELRRRMMSSPIGMQQSFARHMEDALRQMWRHYCRSEETGSPK
jgi:predicted O-linked N-acetylglucosamine transferase (SPINDLY family)